MLAPEDFPEFFHAVHGVEPFPWQQRLLREVAESGVWPKVLDLPTASGKTAAMDIAVFHLALDMARGDVRRAPVRIAFVVDRRLVVDDAFARAQKLVSALRDPGGGAVRRVAEALRLLAGTDAVPLIARRLRGGIPREDDWARTPTQPTILCSTVDQIGSRLLFRGYGVSDSMKPIHAGLLGSDCLILLDEAHLAAPLRQTLEWVEFYRGREWREVEECAPWGVALLTATPGTADAPTFALDHEDFSHPVLKARLDAEKPARLVVAGPGRGAGAGETEGREDPEDHGLCERVEAVAVQVALALRHFSRGDGHMAGPAIGVVVNRVARARAVHARLLAEHPEADVRLIIGPARPVDREGAAGELATIRTGVDRALGRPLILVATQCIEAGVDIDLDGLVTEAAPLDALRQRFGRLNRAGRPLSPYAAIVAWKPELSARYEDAVYGRAVGQAWERLVRRATLSGPPGTVNLGVNGFDVPLDAEALAPREDAPVLMPAHLDLLAQTSPPADPSPDVALFLHGTRREPDAVTVVWRADIETTDPEEGVRRLLALAPPSPGEAIELPVWTVRRWLCRVRGTGPLADAATQDPEGQLEHIGSGQEVFRWRGDDLGSRWINPSEIRPGDAIVVPAGFGGVDGFGWNPDHRETATDVGAAAARPFATRRLAVRIAPGLVGGITADVLARTLAGAESRRPKDLQSALLALDLPADVRSDLLSLDRTRRHRPIVCVDAYPTDAEGRTRGIVLLAPFGIDRQSDAEGQAGATEDDASGSLSGREVPIERHCANVARVLEGFADRLGMPLPRRADLRVAGWLHDAGKVDRRFQAWLRYDDPLGPDSTHADEVLAKSGRALPWTARGHSGLPERWRHEALSVRLAPLTPSFVEAKDPELVLWLIGSHHGQGRPFFPHDDAEDSATRALPPVLGLPSTLAPGPGPQSLAFDWNGADWPTLYARLRSRYGTWELARLEAILRLADHRASEQDAMGEGSE